MKPQLFSTPLQRLNRVRARKKNPIKRRDSVQHHIQRFVILRRRKRNQRQKLGCCPSSLQFLADFAALRLCASDDGNFSSERRVGDVSHVGGSPLQECSAPRLP